MPHRLDIHLEDGKFRYPNVLRFIKIAEDALRAADGDGLIVTVQSELTYGKEPVFSLGGDLAFMYDCLNEGPYGAEEISMYLDRIHRLVDLLTRDDVYLICVVDGISAGGGTELCMMADWVIATPRASFSLPEGLFGAFPPFGTRVREFRGITDHMMQEWIVTATRIPKKYVMDQEAVDGDTALQMANSRAGMVSRSWDGLVEWRKRKNNKHPMWDMRKGEHSLKKTAIMTMMKMQDKAIEGAKR